MANENRIVILTEAELEALIYKACNKATSTLYEGLAKRFLYQNESDMRLILAELDDIKRGEF